MLDNHGTHKTAAIERWFALHDEHPKPFIWTKSADEILQALAWTRQRIDD